MAERVYEGLTVGYCLALTQFVMVLVLGLLYLQAGRPRSSTRSPRRRSSSTRGTPAATPATDGRHGDAVGSRAATRSTEGRDDRLRRGQHHGDRRLRGRPLDHARHHVLGVQARLQRRRLLRRRARHHRLPERPRDLRRLPVGRLVPRHRRPDLPVRLRRLRLLDRLPRRVPDRDVPARRADAELGQVHDRRRAGLPPARAPRARRGGDRHAQRRRLLPDRADGRRGCADPGAGGHRLHARGADHRHVHARLRRLRRHGRHDVGADHQGLPADGRHRRDVDLRVREDELQPDRAVQPGRGGRQGRGLDVLARPGHVPQEQHRHGLARPRARARHRGPAAHPHALLHRAGREGRARRRSSTRCSSSASSTC